MPVTIVSAGCPLTCSQKAQLGKYAHEDRMPEWLVTLLKRDGQVASQGVIPVIAQLLETSSSTKYAYVCNPCVQHISKLKKEGTFIQCPIYHATAKQIL